MRLMIILSVFLLGCGKAQKSKTSRIELESGPGQASVLVLGAQLTPELIYQAAQKNVSIEGETILRLSGEKDAINSLDIPHHESLSTLVDEEIKLFGNSKEKFNDDSIYQAKNDFGIIDFILERPISDGRGVIVGVLDDGISPNQSGFMVTSDGKRKLLAKNSNSSSGNFALSEVEDGFSTTIIERKTLDGYLELNGDSKKSSFKGHVSNDGRRICLDLDLNGTYSSDECRGNFSETGDFFILPFNKKLSLIAEVDLLKKELRLLQPEMAGDSHGEGVASVIAGYQLGGLKGMDGVAPGAQIVDYDLSAKSDIPEERDYTLGKFLIAIDWLASQKAEVINISYSLYFTSAKSQTFMAKAIKDLVEKKNVVIAFSAGNNGPGLGSLNRRSIYPDNVLVVGAYVSKELDERVWGTSGIPDDGRLVYYSSQGPGPDGLGPMIVSPLSSLTHSSSEDGFRAFNGTSSATPAVAGATAVLISAIKQNGLSVDATTVVHALRISSKKIAEEPFVTQGDGIPQLKKALEIYKELIQGKRYIYLDMKVNRSWREGVDARGVFLKKSSSKALETYRLELSGVLSKLADESIKINKLTPVRIEYSAGISGANELWVAESKSRLNFDVNPEEILAGKSEGFGEIKIISKVDDSLLGTVPVTVVNDRRAAPFLRTTLSVSAQEGKRIHLNVPRNVKLLKVKARLLEGGSSFLQIGFFDPNYVRVNQFAFTNEFFIATPVSGHHQLTLSMAQGTANRSKVEFEIEEADLNLLTISSNPSGTIKISNKSISNLQGRLSYTSLGSVIKAMVFNNKVKPEIELELPKGKYGVRLRDTETYDLNYQYSKCTIQQKTESGIIPLMTNPYSYDGADKIFLKFRCMPFDYAEAKDLTWKLEVFSSQEDVFSSIEIKASSSKELNIPNLSPGRYRLNFLPSFSDAKVDLGELEVL